MHFLLSQVPLQAQPKAAGFLSKAQGKVRMVVGSGQLAYVQTRLRQVAYD